MTNNNVGEKQNVNQKCEFIAVVSVRNEKGEFSHLNYVQQLSFGSHTTAESCLGVARRG